MRRKGAGRKKSAGRLSDVASRRHLLGSSSSSRAGAYTHGAHGVSSRCRKKQAAQVQEPGSGVGTKETEADSMFPAATAFPTGGGVGRFERVKVVEVGLGQIALLVL